jgi:predicted dinucleotide-binding enzyme
MRIVIIGGFGNFGARISRRFVQEAGLEIIATSRRPNAALASVKTAALDMDSPTFAAQLKALGPDLVIPCAGPF